MLPRDRAVPWVAQYSEALEEISPALQATGWAFYGLATRAWIAISVPLMLVVAVKYGWAVWIKFALVAFVIFGIAMLFTHPTTVPTRAVAAKPKAKPEPRPATAET